MSANFNNIFKQLNINPETFSYIMSIQEKLWKASPKQLSEIDTLIGEYLKSSAPVAQTQHDWHKSFETYLKENFNAKVKDTGSYYVITNTNISVRLDLVVPSGKIKTEAEYLEAISRAAKILNSFK